MNNNYLQKKDNIDLSIIIVNWNQKILLSKCLNSIKQFTHNIKYETIVVDNGSTDGSQQIIKKDFLWVRLICNSTNMGFAAANNKGINISIGRNLLLLNNDTYITDDSLSKMVHAIDKMPQVGAIICKILYPDGRLQYSQGRFLSISGLFFNFSQICRTNLLRPFYKSYDISSWDYDNSYVLPDERWTGGGCLMLKREALDVVGLLDENFGMAYLEDADLCYRIKNAGYQFYYLSSAMLYHYHGFTVSSSNNDFKDSLTLGLQRNQIYFFEKNYGFLQGIIARLFFFFQNAFFLLFLIILLPFQWKNLNKINLYFEMLLLSFRPTPIPIEKFPIKI